MNSPPPPTRVSEMHHCLQVMEILQNIADQVEYGPYLVSFALTCRAFYEPAINARWRVLRSLEPLLMLLPYDKLDWRKEAGLDMLTFSDVAEEEGLTDHEWDRFRHYARRVHELSITLDRTDRDKPLFVYYDCYDFLLEHYPEDRILPNLRKITADVGRVENFLEALLYPEMRSFTWRYGKQQDALDIIKKLRKSVLSLQELTMREDEWREDMATPKVLKELWKTICSLRRLRSLDVLAVSPDVLRHVSKLPSFESLTFHMENLDYGTILAQPFVFLSLRELSIKTSGQKMAPLLSLLSTLPSRGLVSICIKFNQFREEAQRSLGDPEHQPTAQDIRDVSTALARIQTLESVTLHWDIFNPGVEEDGYEIDEDAVRPLFARKGLKNFTLTNAPTAFTAAGLDELAHAWPSLRTLDLGHDYFNCDPILFSLYDLEVFAEHCPELERLALRVEPPSRGDDEKPAERAVGVSRLQSLVMEHMNDFDETSNEIVDTLAFIHRVFPRARTKMRWNTYDPAVPPAEEAKLQKPPRVDCPCGHEDCETDLYPILGSMSGRVQCWNMDTLGFESGSGDEDDSEDYGDNSKDYGSEGDEDGE